MSFQQSLGLLRTAVATYSSLPLSSNTKGDIRIVLDLGTAYTWVSESGSGTWVDWKKVTVSNYNDLQNRPTSSPLAIDTATQAIRNIYLNYVYMFFISLVVVSQNVMKMFEGMLDSFITEDGLDLTRTSGQRRLDAVGSMANIAYYRNNFDGTLDEYTKLLIHGRNYNDVLQSLPEGEGGHGGGGGGMGGGEITYASFFDALYNDILPYNTDADTVITKFGEKSIQFAGTTDSYLIIPYLNQDGNPFTVSGLDFTWDFWVRPDNDDAETLIVDNSFDRTIGGAFKIERLADKKIKVSVVGCSEYVYDMKWQPVDPVSYDVTSVNTVEKEVWSHIALVRSAGYLKLFINGFLEATSSVADNQDICYYKNNMYVPYYEGSASIRIGYDFTGRMEEIRFSKGIARYTSTFTPRTTLYNTPTQSAPCNNMIIQSEGYESDSIPTSARVVIFEQDAVLSYEPDVVETITPNTDIKLYVSRDGGTTFTQATDLKYEMNIYQEVVWGSIYNNVNFLVGTVDLHLQPSGKEIVYKITTHNNKDLLIRAVACNWK
jgi:hypothetical protein